MFKPVSMLVAAAALAAPAMADTSSTFDFRFRYSEADLASLEGAQRVHQQLLLEASNACRKSPPSAQRGVDSACRDNLIAGAVNRIDNPLLTGIHYGAARIAQNN